MFQKKVTAPDKKVWHFELLVLPHAEGKGFRRRFLTKRQRRIAENMDLPIPDGLDDIYLILILIALIAFMTFIGWPFVMLLLDLSWLLVVFLGALISFGVLRRPITIRAYSRDQLIKHRVVGFRNALKARDELAHSVSLGEHKLDKTPERTT